MANVKDNLIHLQPVYKDLNNLIREQVQVLEKATATVEKYNKTISLKPSDYGKGIDEINEKSKKLEETNKRLETQVKRLTEAKAKSTKVVDEHAKVVERETKAYERERAKLEASANVYTKVQAKLNLLNKEYSDLATKKALGIKLTFEEEKRIDFLSQKIQKYDQTLKWVDATMGKYQRKVGNYASAIGSSFDPLSNSIQQLTREMPAFTYSVQTGFMAISNNLPIFFDAMKGVIDQNKQLQAQGQPTKSVLKQLAGAFFGWGTVLSVGITLLTVYGKEIGEFLFATERKKKAIEEEKKALEEKNNVENKIRENQINYANDELTRANLLLSTAKNLRLSNEERLKAVDELQKRYPDYLGNLSKEEILAGKTAIAESRLTEALMKRAIFLGLQDKIKETSKKLAESELEYAKLQQKNIGLDNLYSESQEKKINKKAKLRALSEDELETLGALKSQEKDYQNSLKKSNIQMLSNEDVRRQKKISVLEELQGLFKLLQVYEPYNNVVNENTTATEKGTKAKKEKTKVIEELIKGTEAYYNQMISDLKKEQSTLADNTTQYKIYAEAIAEVQAQLENLQGLRPKGLQSVEITPIDGDKALAVNSLERETQGVVEYNEMLKRTAEAKELLRQKAKELADQLHDTFGMDLINNSGLTNFFDLVENGLDRFGENWEAKTSLIMEATQEMFNFISGLSHANFQSEYEMERQRRDNAIVFAGESAEAKAEIEKEHERRMREIRRREVKAKRSDAMFNVGIDTAQAIMRAWAQNTLNAPLMTAIIGGIGIAQMAAISSRPLPEFWKGTDNAPEGFALTQERGREIITNAKGQIKSFGSDKGSQLTYLNKGDKVLKHSDTMRELNNILLSNSINPYQSPQIDLSPLNSRIDSLKNAILSKESFSIVEDSNGKAYFKEKNGQFQNLKNARLELKSRVV